MAALVSIILVNWNRADEILENIGYLRRQRYAPFELIVVDNGSTDGSIEHLRDEKDLQLIELAENRGPAAARNVGAERAKGQYLVFVDSDAWLSKRGLRRLVDRMEADATIGIAGCRVINLYSRKVDQWIYAEPYETYGKRCFETYSFSAAGAIVRADLFKQIGGFWEDLFIYNEEVDLSLRVFQAGYRIVYVPDVTSYHRVSDAGRVPSRRYFHLIARNWVWIFYRYYPWPSRWEKIGKYIAIYMIKGVASGQLTGCITGLWAGLRRGDLVRRFPDKLTSDQVCRYEALNRRSDIRLVR